MVDKSYLKLAVAGLPPHTTSGAPPSVMLSQGVTDMVGDVETVTLSRDVVAMMLLLVKPQPYSALTCTAYHNEDCYDCSSMETCTTLLLSASREHPLPIAPSTVNSMHYVSCIAFAYSMQAHQHTVAPGGVEAHTILVCAGNLQQGAICCSRQRCCAAAVQDPKTHYCVKYPD